MSGKKLQLKYLSFQWLSNSGGLFTDLNGYFQIVIGVLMTATFVTLALIVLNAYYGKDEKETSEKD
jgi:hypothetical protein